MNSQQMKTNLDSWNGLRNSHGRHIQYVNLIICTRYLSNILLVNQINTLLLEFYAPIDIVYLQRKEKDLETQYNTRVEIQFEVKISFSPCLVANPQELLPFHLKPITLHMNKGTAKMRKLWSNDVNIYAGLSIINEAEIS